MAGGFRLRTVRKDDEEVCKRIWLIGIMEDLPRLWWKHNSRQPGFLLVCFILVFVGYYCESMLLGFAAALSWIYYIKMRAKWGNAFYVASRKDMDAISEIYRERFIVAESQATGEILGTACYQTFVENYTHWNGEKLPENCWELFSLSVKPAARRLGLGKLLLEEVEKRARIDGADLFFTASVCNHPATSFYTRNGYKVVLG
ncbi:unnamed protein product [Oikopleura dioica]|uniref:N-acetyltransferase domain-containing protein n=1 Tax=Oikopleura dioica TaxID=34765 RepID=E4WVG8_OIKDI|nr:unnamed protein product [Oikopleura dioica]